MIFLLKYIFRLLHIGSYGVFSAILLNDILIQDSESKISKLMTKREFILLALTLMISGFVNMIILIKENKFKKSKSLTFWKYLLYIKFCLFLLLTPFFERIILPLIIKDSENTDYTHVKANFKFMFFTIALIISSFTRFYRETYLIKEKIE